MISLGVVWSPSSSYWCETGADCGFMSWDVPTAEDCPQCGMTMFKKSGKGRMKPFCINETCANFLPEDKRGYYKKKTAEEEASPAEAEESGKKTAKKASSARKPAAKKTEAKKTAEKKSTAKKTSAKKTTTKKTAKKEEAGQ